jgi:hypothetical protein
MISNFYNIYELDVKADANKTMISFRNKTYPGLMFYVQLKLDIVHGYGWRDIDKNAINGLKKQKRESANKWLEKNRFKIVGFAKEKPETRLQFILKKM